MEKKARTNSKYNEKTKLITDTETEMKADMEKNRDTGLVILTEMGRKLAKALILTRQRRWRCRRKL